MALRSNVSNARDWFQVIGTTARSQTAIMRLDANASSSEELNTHPHSDQVLLVLEGEVRGEIAGETLQLARGDFVTIPAGTPHHFQNTGDAPALTFNVYAPPAYPEGEAG